MPVCRKCGRNAVNRVVSCHQCGLDFHEGCLARFIGTKSCNGCCVKTYKALSAPLDTLTLPSRSERDSFFDLGSNLGASSLHDISDLSVVSNSPDCTPCAVDSSSPVNQLDNNITMSKPPNWNALSIDDKIGELFNVVIAGNTTLNNKFDMLAAKVESQDTSFRQLFFWVTFYLTSLRWIRLPLSMTNSSDFNRLRVRLWILTLRLPRKLRHRASPWFTPDLKSKCKARDRLYRAARLSRNRAALTRYKAARIEVKRAVRRAREEYLVQGCSVRTKCWGFLRKNGLVPAKSKSPLHLFGKDTLAEYYSSVTCAHPVCSPESLQAILDGQYFSLGSSLEFRFRHLDCVEVAQSMRACLPKAKGRSCDELSLSYFQSVIPQIAPFFTDLFNSSIACGAYPSIWKRSVIVPLSKCTTPSSPGDTRPVANLPHFAKVFDKIITDQVIEYLEDNSLISPYQSGFRSNYSTQSALLNVSEDIRRGSDKGLLTLLLLFDFKRAFDSINHATLLAKLKSIGFSNDVVLWFHSYLTGRSQAVFGLDGSLSDFLPNTSGVPQGSSPGPVIFLIYINEIVSVLRHCKNSCMLFADDLQIYIQCSPDNIDSAVAALNEDASCILRWSQDNGLLLNVGKTKAMIIGSTQLHMRLDLQRLEPILVGVTPIPFEDSVKNLGVIFSKTLSWNAHVSRTYSNAHFALYRLRFKGYCLPSSLKAQLVNALVLPYIDYACLVCMDLPDYLAIKLQRLCNSAVRYIFYLRKDSPLGPYYAKLGWLSLDHRRNYYLGITLYKLFVHKRPAYLADLFALPTEDLRRSARNNPSAFVIPAARTEIFRNSFTVRGMHFWDSLPVAIRLRKSLCLFKQSLYDYLLSLPQNYVHY